MKFKDLTMKDILSPTLNISYGVINGRCLYIGYNDTKRLPCFSNKQYSIKVDNLYNCRGYYYRHYAFGIGDMIYFFKIYIKKNSNVGRLIREILKDDREVAKNKIESLIHYIVVNNIPCKEFYRLFEHTEKVINHYRYELDNVSKLKEMLGG